MDTMAAQDKEDRPEVIAAYLGCALVVTAIFFGGMGYVFHGLWLEITSGDAEYTVTITGVDGLDAAALLEQQRSNVPLSPALGIAVRIDNTLNKAGQRCLGMHSSAVVSYSDAVLGKGSVPEFCAQALGVAEGAATAWAMDAQVPRFLRNRLAGELARGEAVLDVAVRTAGAGLCYSSVPRCKDRVLVCKAKIGGGPSPPCLVTEVDPWSTASESFQTVGSIHVRAPKPFIQQRDADL